MGHDRQPAGLDFLISRLLVFTHDLLPPSPERAAAAHRYVCDGWEEIMTGEHGDFRDADALFRVLCRVIAEHVDGDAAERRRFRPNN